VFLVSQVLLNHILSHLIHKIVFMCCESYQSYLRALFLLVHVIRFDSTKLWLVSLWYDSKKFLKLLFRFISQSEPNHVFGLIDTYKSCLIRINLHWGSLFVVISKFLPKFTVLLPQIINWRGCSVCGCVAHCFTLKQQVVIALGGG